MRTAPVLLIVLLDMLGFGLILPLLPFAAQRFGAGPVEIGLIAAIFPLCQTTTTAFWGALSDRVGRKPVLFGSAVAAVGAYVLFATATSYPMLLLSRGLAGVTAASLGVAKAYLADVSDDETLPKTMGLFAAAQALGFLFGPAIGALLAGGLAISGYSAAALSALSAVLIVAIPEPRERSAKDVTPMRETLQKHPQLLSICVVFFLVTFAFSHLFVAFPLRLQQAHGYGAKETGYSFVLLSVVAVLVQAVAFPKLIKRAPESVWLLVGGGIMIASLLVFPLNDSLASTLAFVVCGAAGYALATPSMLSLVAKSAGAEAQGFAAGLSESLGGLGRALGPLVAGIAMKYGIYYAFVSSAALTGVALFVHIRRRA